MDEKKEVKIPTLTLNPNETEVAAAQAVQEQVNAVAEEVKEEVPAEKLGLDSLTPEEQAAVMEFVDKIREKTLGLIPVIATAEIAAPERAAQILDTGADLLAVTNSPFHYGPRLVYRIVKYLEKR